MHHAHLQEQTLLSLPVAIPSLYFLTSPNLVLAKWIGLYQKKKKKKKKWKFFIYGWL